MANLHRVSHKKRNGKNMSTVMDVEENFVPVNSREDIEKVMSSSGEKKKTKYFKKLFQFLGGGDSPIEAVELALGRDTSLRETQFSVLSIFSLWVDEFNCQTMVGHNERKNLLNFLSNCNIVKLIVRLITLNAVQPDGKVLFSKYIYYHCVNILAHLTNTRYIDNALERLKNMKVIRAYHAIPRLVEFLNPLHSDPLTIYQSSEVLKHLAKEKPDMCFRIHKADGLRRCLHFMLRKEADKMFADYFKENFSSKFSMPSEEVEILGKFYTGKKSILEKTEQYPRVTGFLDHRKECLTYMSAELQENCALVVFEIVSHPKISKAEILTLKPFIKVLNKWFSTPCIWRTERTMLQGCFHLLRGVISEQTPALTVNEFLQNYNILDLLKQHIYNPDPEVLSSVLSLLSELSMRYPELRKKFMASPNYSKLLPVYLLSFDSQVQIWALQCLVSFVQCKSGAKYVMSIGVTAEKLYILREYNSLTTNELIRTLKTEMEKYCKEEWRLSDKMFQDVIVPKYSLERAQKYKEEGNSRFKNEKYDSAIKCYTLGMESVPPVEDFSAAKPYCCDSGFRPWYVLPSVLFTNRAQCYLLMNKWQEAIDDCTQAIVRSYELEKDEAKKILFKTVFRRARAFSELKDYRNALNDISFCLRFNPVATNVRVFFREILTAYRKEFGIESLRRCGTCMEGVGMKLKRCAKCPEMYCSRECQMYAWEEENHKQLCNYTLDENNSE